MLPTFFAMLAVDSASTLFGLKVVKLVHDQDIDSFPQQSGSNQCQCVSFLIYASSCIYSIVNLVFFTWDSWSFLGLQNDVKSFATHQIIVPIYINLHSCWNIFSCMFVEDWKCANCPLIRKKRRHLPPSATHWGMSIVIGQIPVLISAILQIIILAKVRCKNNSWAAFGSRMRNWLGSVVINHLSVCLSSIISPTWKKDPQPNYLFWGSQISLVVSFKKYEVKLEIFPYFQGENSKIFETTT